MLLDCRSLEFRALPIPPTVHLVICNTMVKHELGASEYNTRRAECEGAVRRLAGVLPQIRSLRDLTLQQLDQHRMRLSDTLYKRCRHVIMENDRVSRAASAFELRQITSLGPLMAESHRSLRDDYEVSCAELDFLSDEAMKVKGVYGARMTGGGFGGCIVALAQPRAVDGLIEHLERTYTAKFGIKPMGFATTATAGASVVE